MAGYVSQSEIKPIMAKQYMLENWDKYDVVDSKKEMLELLNILQAVDETLESMHDVVENGERKFCDAFNDHGWSSMRELKEMLFYFDTFYTDEEFIDYIMDRYNEYKEDEEDLNKYPDLEACERIRCLTSDDPKDFCDTQISKTEDGYVVRIWV